MDLNQESIKTLPGWRSESEELANTLTHGFGFLLAVAATIVLMLNVTRLGDRWQIVGCAIYSFSLIAVYAMSTLSHFCTDERQRNLFRKLDQGFIYTLIVGTYTPFSMTYLRTLPWWLFLAMLWAIALFGFFSKVMMGHRVDRVSIWIYVLLGWMPIFAVPFLVEPVGAAGMWWMFIGGLCYTLGTGFLAYDDRVRHFHALWHLSVIAGSVCHFFVILLCVAVPI